MISVIIPTHNDGDNLKTAIQSIQEQTYRDIEIIVVDDFSTDDTKKIVNHLEKDDNRIRYFLCDYKDPKRFNNRGVNINAGFSARNFGLNKAKGEYITFQDGDDFSLLNRLEIQLGLMNKYNVSHLNTGYVWLEERFFGKKIDINKFQDTFNFESNLILSDEIYKKTNHGIGVFNKVLSENMWKRVPFGIKSKKYINKLFFGHQDAYFGTGGCPFLKKSLINKVRFRDLDSRVWPSTKGRGVDRDFNYNLAFTYNDSLFVDIPLYCWRTPTKFSDKYNLDSFLF
jgi:glycosyltransferase involved in cell wall biosynthesis